MEESMQTNTNGRLPLVFVARVAVTWLAMKPSLRFVEGAFVLTQTAKKHT